MEKINVIVGNGVFKLGNSYAFSVRVGDSSHIVRSSSKRRAMIKRNIEEQLARTNTITRNVKKIYSDSHDVLYRMAASHEAHLILD